MSDSGRQMGDCVHNQLADWCVSCLRKLNAELITNNNLLTKMVQDVYEACKDEAMNCPWCFGPISIHREEHNDSCPWLNSIM